jgi:hypothetical protein
MRAVIAPRTFLEINGLHGVAMCRSEYERAGCASRHPVSMRADLERLLCSTASITGDDRKIRGEGATGPVEAASARRSATCRGKDARPASTSCKPSMNLADDGEGDRFGRDRAEVEAYGAMQAVPKCVCRGSYNSTT